MSFSDDEYYELTTPQKINQKKGRMEELALGILPVKSNISKFIPQDRHQIEYHHHSDGSVSHSITKKPRR